MGKFAAYLNAALAVAWLALFFTNDALFVSHETDLSDHLRGDAFAMVWAGSAICSRLYIALVNYGVELRYATAIFCIPSLAVGSFAALQIQSFTSLAWAMPLLDLKILANALQGKLKVGGVIHVIYSGDWGSALPDAGRRRPHRLRPRPRGLPACRSSAGISSPPEQQEEMHTDDRQAAVRARAGRLCPSVSSHVSPHA